MFNLETLRLLSKIKKAPDFTAKFANEAKGGAYFWMTGEGVIYLIDLRGLPAKQYFSITVHSRYLKKSLALSSEGGGNAGESILPTLYSNKGHGLSAGLVDYLNSDNLLGATLHLKSSTAHFVAPVNKN